MPIVLMRPSKRTVHTCTSGNPSTPSPSPHLVATTVWQLLFLIEHTIDIQWDTVVDIEFQVSNLHIFTSLYCTCTSVQFRQTTHTRTHTFTCVYLCVCVCVVVYGNGYVCLAWQCILAQLRFGGAFSTLKAAKKLPICIGND